MAKRNTAGQTAKKKTRRSKALPTRKDVLEFIQSSPDKIGKREIARAFQVKGADRVELKRLLKEMADEGLITGARKRISKTGTLPPVAVIEVVAQDEDGEPIAQPSSWNVDRDGPPPRILVLSDRRSASPPPGLGDRLLARIAPSDDGDGGVSYEAKPIKRLPRERTRLLGIFRKLPRGGGVIDPIDRKQLKEWPVSKGDDGDAGDGELVRFEVSKGGRYGVPKARVAEALGNPEAQGAISLIAIHNHGIPEDFSARALEETETLEAPSLAGREDLRSLPLITIDPADARDHDDAVWAARDDDPANPNGWVVIVAIADVAWYVRPGMTLNRDALKRGNSVYFPDRVVPMLPEKISNDLCSLREGELRPCLAVRMVFDQKGHKKSHRFMRAMMRSAAKLSYAQAQAAIDGAADDKTRPLLKTVLRPLWHVYDLLDSARKKRGPLELNLPERRIVLDDQGRVADVVVPERLAAHRLIEEFMIQANVCAAETLERRKTPLIYRVHEAPAKEKLAVLGDFLATLDIKLPKAGVLKPEQFNRILAQVEGSHISDLVSEVILRAQAQAVYSPDNLGHFGLNLRRYAHFTSPIRRYADLIVHRALIHALDLGAGGLTEAEIGALEPVAESISNTERRAMAAERETADRLIAAYLADRIGATFAARVSGLTRSGLFVRLSQTGADGFVPAATLMGDFYWHDERQQALVGERTGHGYRLGDTVEVRLVEAIPSAGALRFELLTDGRPLSSRGTRRRSGAPAKKAGRKGPRRRR